MIHAQVRNYCGATRAMVAVVRQAQQMRRSRVRLDFAECLNECHNLPVVKATPPSAQRAIERALREKSKG